MYGIFTYIYPINEPNVGKYTIHGASGIVYLCVCVGNADKKRLEKYLATLGLYLG